MAVITPVIDTSPSGLRVIPDPTRVSDLNVAIPATSKIPVLMFSVPIPVNADPSIAGSGPVKLLAAREPLKVVAVIIPVASIPDSLTVTADPTVV